MSKPTNTLLNRMLDMLADDSTTLAGGLLVQLINAPFAATRTLTWGDVSATLVSSVGMTAVSVAMGPQQRASNPVTGDELIQIIPPAGGFRWESDAAPDPAFDVYGLVVTSATGNGETVFLSERFSEPIVINAAHQVVEVLAPDLRLTLEDFFG